jgi:PAS domain S-box-containing protein
VHFLRSIANLLASAVTARRAEHAHRDSEARMKAIVNTAVDGIIVIDERGTVESVNPAVERLFGFAADQLLGQNVSVLMPEPYRSEHDQYVKNYLHTRVPKVIGIGREVVGLRKDGTTFPMDLSISEFMLGSRRMFTGIVHDITERRRLEREILETSGNEQRRIGQDLHDGLCQQLTGIAFAHEILARKLATDAPERVQDVRKIADLVDETLTQARGLARGLNPIDIQAGGLPIALEGLASQISELFSVACRYEQEGSVAVSDSTVATHLYRIAQEAISNALRHGKATRIDLSFACVDERLTLSISDNGRGISDTSGRPASGMGLQIMSYRARLIGASFSARPGNRGGTVVICVLRCPADSPKETTNGIVKAATVKAARPAKGQEKAARRR